MGHFEAIRWFVVSGLLGEVLRYRVAIFMNYTNWGHVFSNDTLRIARYVSDQAREQPGFLFLAEVKNTPLEKRTGSLLVDEIANPHGVCVVPSEANVINPAFDITPAELITAIISERGVVRSPDPQKLAQHLA